jgi:hypothetical protein
MRIYPSPVFVTLMNKKPQFLRSAPACQNWNVSASAKFQKGAYFFHGIVLLMPSRHTRVSLLPMLHDCCAAMAARWERRGSIGHLSGHDTAG